MDKQNYAAGPVSNPGPLALSPTRKQLPYAVQLYNIKINFECDIFTRFCSECDVDLTDLQLTVCIIIVYFRYSSSTESEQTG